MPSGSFRPSLTMVFKSEPSGFDVRMRPAERSKKYKRATVFAASSAVSDLEALEDDIESFIPFSVAFIYERRFGRSALIWLDESAEAGNGLAENQVLHLEGALVGVESFQMQNLILEIGSAHVSTPVTRSSPIPPSPCNNKPPTSTTQ